MTEIKRKMWRYNSSNSGIEIRNVVWSASHKKHRNLGYPELLGFSKSKYFHKVFTQHVSEEEDPFSRGSTFLSGEENKLELGSLETREPISLDGEFNWEKSWSMSSKGGKITTNQSRIPRIFISFSFRLVGERLISNANKILQGQKQHSFLHGPMAPIILKRKKRKTMCRESQNHVCFLWPPNIPTPPASELRAV